MEDEDNHVNLRRAPRRHVRWGCWGNEPALFSEVKERERKSCAATRCCAETVSDGMRRRVGEAGCRVVCTGQPTRGQIDAGCHPPLVSQACACDAHCARSAHKRCARMHVMARLGLERDAGDGLGGEELPEHDHEGEQVAPIAYQPEEVHMPRHRLGLCSWAGGANGRIRIVDLG